MANKASAKKRARQSLANASYNRNYRAGLRKIKKELLQNTKSPDTNEKLKKTVAYIQRIAAKGVIHRNKAANLISRLTIATQK